MSHNPTSLHGLLLKKIYIYYYSVFTCSRFFYDYMLSLGLCPVHDGKFDNVALTLNECPLHWLGDHSCFSPGRLLTKFSFTDHSEEIFLAMNISIHPLGTSLQGVLQRILSGGGYWQPPYHTSFFAVAVDFMWVQCQARIMTACCYCCVFPWGSK
jgi:hypothetical protein